MNKLLLTPLFALLALTGCDNLDVPPGVPECVVERIKKFKKSALCDNGNSVAEYKFQDKTVYVLSDGNCYADRGSRVIDSECNDLGFLFGVAGKRIINGVEFFPNATLIRTIWKN